MSKPKCIVCDIDGTIADLSHRLHHIQGEKKDWDSFYGGVSSDKPIRNVVRIVKGLLPTHNILFCTGRSDQTRNETVIWVNDNVCGSIHSDNLYMRKEGDHRPDTEVKPELLKEIEKDYDVIAILEDRNSVVKRLRELGYTVLQVADGDF